MCERIGYARVDHEIPFLLIGYIRTSPEVATKTLTKARNPQTRAV